MARAPDTGPVGGYEYFVNDAQLRVFSRLTPLQRLRWLEQARLVTLLGRTPETAARQERLRRGEAIING